MKLVRGMIIGGMLSVGLLIMYGEAMGMNRKKIMKQGKRIIKKMT